VTHSTHTHTHTQGDTCENVMLSLLELVLLLLLLLKDTQVHWPNYGNSPSGLISYTSISRILMEEVCC